VVLRSRPGSRFASAIRSADNGGAITPGLPADRHRHLGGYYAFRVLVFKVGLYDPIISFAPQS
jgi:hypothetical protein